MGMIYWQHVIHTSTFKVLSFCVAMNFCQPEYSCRKHYLKSFNEMLQSKLFHIAIVKASSTLDALLKRHSLKTLQQVTLLLHSTLPRVYVMFLTAISAKAGRIRYSHIVLQKATSAFYERERLQFIVTYYVDAQLSSSKRSCTVDVLLPHHTALRAYLYAMMKTPLCFNLGCK